MKKYLLALIIFFAPLASVQAATIYFSPEKGEMNIGDIFTVDVMISLDSSEECVNTILGEIGFDNNFLAAVDFATGESFLSLWLEKPGPEDMAGINQQKRLKFSGGTPGGYCGKIPGDDGNSNIVGKIIFRAVNSGVDSEMVTNAKLFFYPGTKALLNDGFGTEAKLTLKEANFGISKIRSGAKQEWDKLKTADNVPPEPFTLELLKNPNVYGGKYYLVWNTADKQTGIDHYEAQEVKIAPTVKSFFGSLKGLFWLTKKEAAWTTVNQPYVVEDQLLKSLVRIKAVDKAGNSQIAEYLPAQEENANMDLISKVGPVVILLILAIYIFWRLKVRHKN